MRSCFGILGGLVILLTAIGCRERMPDLKPPPEQVREDFFLPSENDARYSSHVQYPQETLQTDPFTLMQRKTQPVKRAGAGRPGSIGMR